MGSSCASCSSCSPCASGGNQLKIHNPFETPIETQVEQSVMGLCASSLPEEVDYKGQGVVRAVLIAGPPAAGKGTQCDWLSDRYGLVHISSGSALRDQVAAGTELGAKAQLYMKQGVLVPSDLLIDVIIQRISQPDVVAQGCLLDNFPLTSDQANAIVGKVHVDHRILLDVPDDVLIERALGRRLDPLTGSIYNQKSRPAPPEVTTRLCSRNDDTEEIMRVRLKTYQRHFQAVAPFFKRKTHVVDGTLQPDEVFNRIVERLDLFSWSTDSEPYFGSSVFSGPFDAISAKRAGFYSPDFGPENGERVVCFRRGPNYQKRGTVVKSEPRTSSGIKGLRTGCDGLWVDVDDDKGGKFSTWTAFLAPVNDKEYSALCTTAEFRSSYFAQLYSCSKGLGDAETVEKKDARASLQDWVSRLEDTDGEPVDVSDECQQKILGSFDEQDFPSLYLYTTQQKLGPRTSLIQGRDYSLYYRALNNTLNNDSEANLSKAMPLIKRMTHLLLYSEDGERILHNGGRLWKGDAQVPVPLNMQKLKQANKLGRVIRFRQFISSTTDEKLALKYRKREDGHGFLWIINVPPKFWGASDVQQVSWREHEAETLFPPYAAFRVRRVESDVCELEAVDRRTELDERSDLHDARELAMVMKIRSTLR